MPKTRPPYDEEFRRDALELYRTSTIDKTQLARELGISTNTLRDWIKKDARGGEAPVANGGQGAPAGAPEAGESRGSLAEENRALRKRIRHLERQHEILNHYRLKTVGLVRTESPVAAGAA